MPGTSSSITIPVPGSFTVKLESAKAKELAIERSRLKNPSKPPKFRLSKPIAEIISALELPATEHRPSESQGFSLDTQAGLKVEVSEESLDHEKAEGLGYQKLDPHKAKNRYAGLISVKKRKRGDHERTAASNLIVESGLDVVPAYVNVGDGHIRKKGPFAPAKKPARTNRPTYGNM